MINIGIDVHKRLCVATIKNESTKRLEQITFSNDTKGMTDFIKHVKKTYNDTARAVCESTANYWMRLHDKLEEEGIDTILAHPAKTKIIAQAKLKDDKIDSEILTDLLKSDMIYESFVPNKYYRDLRNLVRTRIGRSRDGTQHKNKIHAILAKYDYPCPTKGVFTKKGMKWLKSIPISEIDRMSMDIHLECINTAITHVQKLEQKMAQIAQDDDRVKLLLTIPGIGYITALTIISELVDITRYSTAEKFAAGGGVIPSHRNSASTYRGGGITKEGSVWMRNAIVEAATITIQYDPRMQNIYERVKKRRGAQKAKVAVARHLLEIIWYMLTYNEEYRTQNCELTQRKHKRLDDIAKMS